MPNPHDLLSLAERCEKAEAGSFALECEVARAAGRFANPPRTFTSSTDAATSLMPAGTMYRSGHDGAGPDPSLFFCEAITDAPACHRVRSVAATEALARVAASLRALAAMEAEKGGNDGD